jgi:hypothetical protein
VGAGGESARLADFSAAERTWLSCGDFERVNVTQQADDRRSMRLVADAPEDCLVFAREAYGQRMTVALDFAAALRRIAVQLGRIVFSREPDRPADAVRRQLALATAFGLLNLTCALLGCSAFSSSNVPMDCDAVMNQEQAGLSDTKIAADLGTTVDKVAACHGLKTAVGPQQ